jgi:hypothetical protein
MADPVRGTGIAGSRGSRLRQSRDPHRWRLCTRVPPTSPSIGRLHIRGPRLLRPRPADESEVARLLKRFGQAPEARGTPSRARAWSAIRLADRRGALDNGQMDCHYSSTHLNTGMISAAKRPIFLTAAP